MAVEKMSYVNIVGTLSKFDDIANICVSSDAFHPENAANFIEGTMGFLPFDEENPYYAALRTIENYIVKTGHKIENENFESFEETAEDLEKQIDELTDSFIVMNDKKIVIDEDITENEQIVKQLLPLINLDINLDYLLNLNFVKFRFGRLPRDSYEKLRLYLSESLFYFFPAEIQIEYVWGMYLTPRSNVEKADSIFASLLFERIRLSEKVHGTPKEAYDEILAEIESSKKEQDKNQSEIDAFLADNKSFINKAYCKTKYSHDIYELRRFAAHSQNNFYISGWIPEKISKKFADKFEDIESISCIIEKPSDTNIEPPTKLKNFKLFKPFEQFVSMYGLPNYYEVDPTPLLAITYIILFGIMFGDIGQGSVLLIGGLVLWFVKKANFGKILFALGISSIVFGSIYGSIFGIEMHFGFKTLEQTNLTLLSAVGIGIFLLSLAMIINVINGVKQKNIEKSLFGPNGIAGIMFYWGVVFAAIYTLGFGKNMFTLWYVLVFVVFPLIVIYFKHPLANLVKRKKGKKEGIGDFIIENTFEIFELCLGFMSNTISFVRIGAYALSHAGMMIVVFLLADLAGKSGSFIIIILGNVLVIALEGLLAGIQVLRLEFYEMFSRFYNGEGKEYEPYKVSKTIKN